MVPWHLIELGDNPDIAWVIWQQTFLGIADYHAPLKKRRARGISSPWITPELKLKVSQNWTYRLSRVSILADFGYFGHK